MTALTGSWIGLVVSASNLDATTYGQGVSFPATWSTTRLFWRSDQSKLYQNNGTEATPVWTAIGTVTPSGTVTMYVGAETDLPTGWLLCDGTAVSRTTYSDLFDVIDEKYGVGDGSTTFNLPNFLSKFPRGSTNDTTRGTTGGVSTVTLTTSQMPSHNHTQASHTHTYSSDGQGNFSSPTGSHPDEALWQSGNTGSATPTINSTGGGGSHENKPPFLDVHFIIAV